MIIELKNSSASVQIDTEGAQLLSFRSADGMEYIWNGDKQYWGGRAPILFPIVGGLRNNKTYIDGKEYSMLRHGFAKRSVFDVVSQSDTEVSFKIEANEDTLKQYPYKFYFVVTFKLDGYKLTTEFTIKNNDTKDMPFAVGGHPAIKCPLADGESFEDYVLEFEKNETAQCPTVIMDTGLIDFEKRYPVLNDEASVKMQHSLFYQDAMIFDNLKSKSCKLYNPSTGNGVEIDFADFKMLGVWSAVNDAPFVCLEPWIGCATADSDDDNFLSKRDMIILAPDTQTVKSFTLGLLK